MKKKRKGKALSGLSHLLAVINMSIKSV